MDAPPVRPRRTPIVRAGVIVALAVVAALAILLIWLGGSRFVAQDSCLDAGGRWAGERCEGARAGG